MLQNVLTTLIMRWKIRLPFLQTLLEMDERLRYCSACKNAFFQVVER